VSSWSIPGSGIESWDDIYFLCVKLVFQVLLYNVIVFSSLAVKELSTSYNILEENFFFSVSLYVVFLVLDDS